MLNYKQIIKRLRLGSNAELFNKLSDEDYDYIFVGKEIGIFTQIKKNLTEVNTLETEIPKVGRLVTSAAKIKRKIGELYKRLEKIETDLLKPLLLITEKKELNDSKDQVNEAINKFVILLIKKYEQYDYDNAMTKKGNTKELITMGTSIHIDIIKREQVEKLLSDSKLTLDKFKLEMKRINVPVTKAWFLVAFQIVNDLVIKKKESKMSKLEFKKQLEDAGLYIETI